MAGKAILTCRHYSHPFQERILVLDQPVKIGRSVARSRSAPNNAIFDCKVLSRNHATIWCNNGKFFLQDTKSSNGTFVNNQRLSKSGEESLPREIFSGDVVQFGVDVLENARKVTHGCIVADIKLYLPDGKEAKQSEPSADFQTPGTYYIEDLYLLNEFIQEACQRELILKDRLATLQSLLDNVSQTARQGWKALITEDKLLSRVEYLETQLQTYSKEFSDDKLRNEQRKLLEDKERYQIVTKDTLRKIFDKKIEYSNKYKEIKSTLNGKEDDLKYMQSRFVKGHLEIQDLAKKYSFQLAKTEELQQKYQELGEKYCEVTDNMKPKSETLDILDSIDLNGEQAVELDKDLSDDELIINSNNISIDDENGTFMCKDDNKYQPHLADNVQLKLVSQLQEITEKYSMNEEDLENSKFVEEGLSNEELDKNLTLKSADKEKELLVKQLKEAQRVAKTSTLLTAEFRSRLCSLLQEVEGKEVAGDNRLKDELNSARQECSRLQTAVAALEEEIEQLRLVADPPDGPSAAARILQLQEELITVQTHYMACHEERTLLAKQVKEITAQTLTSPSLLIYYILPSCILILAFLFAYVLPLSL